MKEVTFNFNNKNIKIAIINSIEYFCVSDLGKCLELKDIHRRARSLPEKGRILLPTPTDGGMQNIMFVNERNLYRLIFQSKKKESVLFQDWVYDEVLPSIRKTGKYEIGQQLKQISTNKRNELTDMWKEHGCTEPHHYINLTREEYKLLFDDAKKKKANMTREEILTLSALESMEALALFHGNQNGYYECRDSLKKTAKQIPSVIKKEIEA